MLKSLPTFDRVKNSSRCLPNFGFFALLVLSLSLLFAGSAKGTNFTTALDQNRMSTDDRATFTMSFEGGHPDTVPDIPGIPNLNIQYVGKGSSVVQAGGQVVSTISVTFAVSTTLPGTYVIPAISTVIEGQTYSSQPLTLVVTKAPQQTYAFMKLICKKNDVYVGEVVPVRIEFYFQFLQTQQIPTPHFKEEGFTLGKIALANQSTTLVEGRQYYLAVLDTTVTPVKVGTLELGPATMELAIPRSPPRQTVFGTQVEWKEATLETEPKTLQVLPLPQNNIPPGFNGAVGNFSLDLSVTPTNIAVGDPLTIKVDINGRGALDAITLPAQSGWQKFKSYPPTSTLETSDPLEVSGTKHFLLTAVPESLDIKELPPFYFSYFDPDQRSYKTLTHAPIPITVRPSAASLPPPTLASNLEANENSSTNELVAPIKQRLGSLAQINKPLIKQSWFLGLQCIPVLAWCALFISRKRAENLANNPRLRREREVEKIIRNGLAELRQAADANDAAGFFAILFHLLQEQIGERLDQPASAITEAVINERLRPLGMAEDQLAGLHELFQACNQALYAPKSTHEELVSFIEKLESALANLKKIKA